MQIFQTYLISWRFRIMQPVKYCGRFRKIATCTFIYSLRILKGLQKEQTNVGSFEL